MTPRRRGAGKPFKNKALEEAMSMRGETAFDYLVAGAGSAGSVLANRLSADGRRSVPVREAGGLDDWIWFRIPVGYLYAMGHPRADWCYRTEAGLTS